MKDTSLRGLDLAIETMAHIELSNEYDETLGLPTWDQGRWGVSVADPVDDRAPACGTAYCYAGWAIHLAGEERWTKTWVTDGEKIWVLDMEQTPVLAATLLGLEEPERQAVGTPDDYDFEYVGEHADHWSGGMPYLFDAENSIESLRCHLSDLYGVTYADLVVKVAERKKSLLAELRTTSPKVT